MITIQNLHFGYNKKSPLFKDLSLSIPTGKIYGLLGKNGTGKSSLLKLITGVLFPDQGDLRLADFDPSRRKPDMLNQIFFLSEDYVLPAIDAEKYCQVHRDFYPGFDQNKYNEIINILKVPQDQALNKLSFGQKKKFLIAFGIATNAKYLLLDEPTNGLDIPSKTQFRKVMASGFQEEQLVVMSTHQIRDLSNLIESVIIVEEGRVLFYKDLFEIEEKLFFSRALSPGTHDNAIYSEMDTGGYVDIVPNTNLGASQVELEILFNAVLQKGHEINQLF